MQSDGNSFCGDVVSYNFTKTSRDEYNILYKIYKSKYVLIIIIMIIILYNIIQKCLLTIYKSAKTKFYEFLVVLCFFSLNMNILQSLWRSKIFIIKIQKDSFFIFCSVLNAVFINVYTMVKLSETKTPQILFPSDCITLYVDFLVLTLYDSVLLLDVVF